MVLIAAPYHYTTPTWCFMYIILSQRRAFIIHQDRNVHTFSIVLPCGELVNKRLRHSTSRSALDVFTTRREVE